MSAINPEHLNHDFMWVLEQFRRHLKEAHIVRLSDVKDAIFAYLNTWIQVAKDSVVITTKIEIFQLAAEVLDPNASEQVRTDFASKLAARRYLNGQADRHIEALVGLITERGQRARFTGGEQAFA